ncbi:MAG: hypothetical protein ACYDEB_12690, partial [Dehalococcoidia bacterium]
MAFVSSALIFGSLVLLIAWFARSRNHMEDRVRELSGERRALIEKDDPFSQRVMMPAVHGFTTRLLAYMPTSMV